MGSLFKRVNSSSPTGERDKRRTAVGGVALAEAVVAGCGGGATSKASTSSTSSTTSSSAAGGSGRTGADAGAVALQQAFVSVVNKVRPEVVETPRARRSDQGSSTTTPLTRDQQSCGRVIHVVPGHVEQLSNGQTLPGRRVGAYPPDDLAVIKVSGARRCHPPVSGTPRP